MDRGEERGVDATVAGSDLRSAAPLEFSQLSPAERRVLDLALDGRSTAGIAEALVLSEATVRTHLTHIYAKLQVHGRMDLLAKASLGATAIPTPDEVTPPTRGAGAPIVWISSVLALVGLGAAVFAPPATVLLGPALVAIGLALKGRLPPERRWVRPLVLTVGGILCVEALVIALFVLGLLALGT